MNLTKLLKDNAEVSTYRLADRPNVDDVVLTKGIRDILDIGDVHGFFDLVSNLSPMMSMDNNYSRVLYTATHQMAFFSFTHNEEFALFGIYRGLHFLSNVGLWKVGQTFIDGRSRNCFVDADTIEESDAFLNPDLFCRITPIGFHGADLSRETLIHGLKLLNKYVR